MKKFAQWKVLGASCLFLFCQSLAVAQVVTVPAPSAIRAERFGTVNWNVDYGAYPSGQANAPDRLNWGADSVAALGTKVIGAYLGFQDIYGVAPPNTADLAALARTPAYDKLFRDTRFKTYALWTYSRGAAANNWQDGFSAAEYAAERDEMRGVSEYLLSNAALAGKSFILFNWEAENALVSHGNKDVAWQAFREWHRARVEGVRLAQQRYPESAVKVYSGLQYVRVRSAATGQPCGSRLSDPVNADALRNRCAIDYFGADLPFDYYGYSAWQTVNEKIDNPAVDLKAALKRDLDFWLAYVRAKRPEITSNNFMVLEYGFERARYNECVAADFFDELLAAFEGPNSFPAAYVLSWQVIDNAPHYGYGVGDEYFGFYRTVNRQLQLSLAGQVLQKRLAHQAVTRVSDCPVIRKPPAQPGILDLQTGTTDFRLYPNSTLDFYTEGYGNNPGNPFSASGNVVQIDQRAQKFSVSRNTSAAFTESPTRLNVPLPDGLRPGVARVWVTDARGLTSNNQGIEIRCDTCPFIKSETDCGLLEADYQTRRIAPGSKLAINGERFAASGNTVIVEQQTLAQTVNRYTLPRASVVSETVTQIVVNLPAELSPGFIAVYAVSPQGRPSNAVSAEVETPCVACAPRIKPCNGVVSRAAGANAGKFYANELFEVIGRFSPTGNQIIVEQYDRDERLYRHALNASVTGWRENDRQLSARLPARLFPGRAVVYVENADGLVSSAKGIMITPSAVVSVSAADYRGPEVARESILAAFGNAFSTATVAAARNPLPVELAGVKVMVRDSVGTERAAPLFFVSPTQINYLLPADTSLGAATVTFFNGFGSQALGELMVVSFAPGVFTANATGKGVAAAVAVRVYADGSQVTENVISFDRTTNQWVGKPIDLGPVNEQVFLVLFGTGWRGSTSPITATISGLNAEVSFAGAQGTLVGLDQANLLLPRTLIGRGLVSVSLTVDGKTANAVEINVR